MAGNTVDELVNNLYELVQDAWAMPLGGDRCVIDRERVLDILDEIRANLPTDLRMAKEIVEKRNDLLETARREAENTRKQADEYAKSKVGDHQITAEARKKAAEMIAAAEMRSKELMKACSVFCEDSMQRAEDAVNASAEELKKARAAFKSALK